MLITRGNPRGGAGTAVPVLEKTRGRAGNLTRTEQGVACHLPSRDD